MSWFFPAQGGLKITAKGRTIGIWTEEAPFENTYVIVAELSTRGEWLNGFKTLMIGKQVIVDEIAKRPDIFAYLGDLGYDINAAIRLIYNSAPGPALPSAPTSPLQPIWAGNVIQELNKATYLKFGFNIGADGVPVYVRKAL